MRPRLSRRPERRPKKPGLAAQLPPVRPSQGRSARMPTSAQAGTAGSLLRGRRVAAHRQVFALSSSSGGMGPFFACVWGAAEGILMRHQRRKG